MGELTNGPMSQNTVEDLYNFYILTFYTQRFFLCTHHKKEMYIVLSQKGSQSINSPYGANSSLQRATAHAGDSCSGISSAQPITFLPALAIHHSTLLGAREKVHASFPLNPLAQTSSPLFLISDIHLGGEFTSGEFQGGSISY